MGGVPPTCFYAYTDGIMLRGAGDGPTFSRSFLSFASYYGFRPVRSDADASVTAQRKERIDQVQTTLLGSRPFRSIDDLNDATTLWLMRIANQQTRQCDGELTAKLFQSEIPFLIPLPARPWNGE
jgi:hypothetical protein